MERAFTAVGGQLDMGRISDEIGTRQHAPRQAGKRFREGFQHGLAIGIQVHGPTQDHLRSCRHLIGQCGEGLRLFGQVQERATGCARLVERLE